MRRTARAITQHDDRLLRPAGLRATLTRNLRPLLARGYVRLKSGDDARQRLIAITPRGAAAAAAALPRWRRAQRSGGKHLTPAALEALDAAVRAAGDGRTSAS